MFVKQITISGFKSYRESVAAGPFCSGHNVVVGRNGSGKSNFFDAVRFVLSDTFANLRAEDRIALLHEGAGASVLSAYVEIVFDNSDGRLPFDKDDVALRRMIGLKKDEYVLDRRNVTRSDVFNLLESAGFSRSNPYYIVQQGKVAALVAMTDVQRLDLLKEVAGTRVYDERRNESLKIMEETDGKREKINEVVEYIEERLGELESEKEELKEFQSLDKERRAIEYTIYVKELEETKTKLDEFDVDRVEKRQRGTKLYRLQRENAMTLRESEKESERLENLLRRLQSELPQKEKRRKSAVENVARLRVEVQEADDIARNSRNARETAETSLAGVRATIENRKAELQPLLPLFEEAKRQENEAKKELNQVEKRVLDLRVKLGRSVQFATQEDRDNHLRTKIRDGEVLLEESRRQLQAIQQEAERVERALLLSSEEVIRKQSLADERRSLYEEASQELASLKTRRDQTHATQQELWRKESELNSKRSSLINDVKQQERVIRSAIGSSAYIAINAIKEAAAEDSELARGLYGALYEIISVDDKFATAVDAAAGGALTHVVVNSDKTAATFVDILRRRKAGRVTFIPLENISQPRRPPLPASQDAIPLLNKVKCEDSVRRAVEHIFGGFMIARSVAVASQLSRQSNVDCVTLDGDLVNRRGAMTGGFVDTRRSRMEAATALKKMKVERDECEREWMATKTNVDDIEKELSTLLAEIQSKETNRRGAQVDVARMQSEKEAAEMAMVRERKNLADIEIRITNLEDSIRESEIELQDMQTEVSTPLTSALTPSEERELDELLSRSQNLKDLVAATSQERGRLEVQVERINNELETNLERRATELEKTIRLSSEDPSAGTVEAEEVKMELTTAERHVETLDEELKQLESTMKETEKELKQVNITVEECRLQDSRIEKDLAEEQEQMDTIFNRRALFTQRKEEAEKKIRELGSLPSDFDKHRGSSMETLLRKLKKTNENLKAYSHVNKKALDQYINFTEQRDMLRKRRSELDVGADAIRQLIDSLDTRKDEDIMRTFKGVSKHFSDVFTELVPGGKASLVMQRGDEGDNGRMSYSGVSMKVSFTGTGESYMLNQLSGGQKSIVALTLIFAIQRLDPAPFYLFDEIDANLDATHRQAVANLIHKQAESQTQFITTTFRPEFVNTADKLFGVTHKNKISAVNEIDREEALTFITDVPTR